MPDDFSASVETTGIVAVNGSVSGNIETIGDHDWIAVELVANQNYFVLIEGRYSDPSNTLNDPFLRGLYGPDGSGFSGFTFDDVNLADRSAGTGVLADYTGTHYISVSSYGEGTGTYTLSVSETPVFDDYGVTILEAGFVSVGGEVQGNHETIGDEDWFAVDLLAGFRYRFELVGQGALGGETSTGLLLNRLRDENGLEIVGTGEFEGENGGHSGFPELSVFEYVPDTSGTYYVNAAATGVATGTYTLQVDDLGYIDDYPDNNSSTGVLPVGGSTTGSIEAVNDRDWIAVTLSSGQSYEFTIAGDPGSLTPLSGAGFSWMVYPNGFPQPNFWSFDGPGDTSTIRYLAPVSGTYFIEVESETGAIGDYELSAVQLPKLDDFGDNPTSRGFGSVGGTVSGRMDDSGDIDFISFDLQAGRIYQIDAMGIAGFDPVIDGVFDYARGYFLDTELNRLPNSFNDDFDGESSLDSRVVIETFITGDYFVAVRGFGGDIGDYDLSVTEISTVSDDFGQDIFAAGTFDFQSGVAGRIENETDEDWFRLTLDGGITYSFGMNWPFDYEAHFDTPELRILSASGQDILDYTLSHAPFERAEITFTPDQSGTFYLVVGDASTDTGTGNYFFDWSTEVISTIDDYAGDVTTTGAFEAGGQPSTFVTGTIEENSDVDWFAVNLTAGRAYGINLKGADTGGGTLPDPFLVGVFDNNGVFLGGQDDNSGEGRNASATYVASYTGVHYFAASHVLSGGADTGSYVLQYDDLGLVVSTVGQDGLLNEGNSTLITRTFEDIGFDPNTVYDWNVLDLSLGGTAVFPDDYLFTTSETADSLIINITSLDDRSLETDETIEVSVSGYVEVIAPSSAGEATFFENVYGQSIRGSLTRYDFQRDLSFVINSAPVGPDSDFVLNGPGDLGLIGNVLTGFSDTEGDSYSVDPFQFFVGNFEGEVQANGDVFVTAINGSPGIIETYSFAVIDERGAQTLAQLSLSEQVLDDDYLPGVTAAGFGILDVGIPGAGSIEDIGDEDRFNIALQAGRTYAISLTGADGLLPPLFDPEILGVFDFENAFVPGSADQDNGPGADALVSGFSVPSDGTYQIAVAGQDNESIGSYELTVSEIAPNEIFGTPGDDIDENSLSGTDGDDIYYGLAGRDYFNPGLGNDTIDGGPDGDVAIYDNLPGQSGIRINNTPTDIGDLPAFTVDKGARGTDRLIDIEQLHGTFYDDLIYASDYEFGYVFDRSGEDTVHASQEDDAQFGLHFNAGTGNDTYIGNHHFDGIVFDADAYDIEGPVNQPVFVDLIEGYAIDGWGYRDTLIDIDGAHGTEFNDTFMGGPTHNYFNGYGGQDTIIGGPDHDNLLPGLGADLITGNTGFDRFWGQAQDFDGDTITDLEVGDWFRITNADDEAIPADILIIGDLLTIDITGDGIPEATVTLTNGFQGPIENEAGRITESVIVGTDGDDIFDESLFGTSTNDLLQGLNGDDWLFASPGNDTLDGGEGSDAAIYDGLQTSTGLRINNTSNDIGDLPAHTVDKGELGTDQLVGIDSFNGTSAADLIYQSNAGPSYAFDRGGNDTVYAAQGEDAEFGTGFLAGSGADTYIGNQHFDSVSFLNDYLDIDGPISQGVFVDLAEGYAFDGWGYRDTLVEIDGIHATDFNDTLIGDDENNYLDGLGGNDLLIGGLDGDILLPGQGIDTMTGGGGRDEFWGQALHFDGGTITDLSEDDCFDILDTDGNSIAANIDISGDQLTIDIDGDGTAEATVTLTNGYQGPVKNIGGRISYPDDYSPGVAAGPGALVVGERATGVIETAGDEDAFDVFLTAGTTYQINLRGGPTDDGTLADPLLLGVFDSLGAGPFSQTFDDDSGIGTNSLSQFTPSFDGTYQVIAGAFQDNTGSYTISIEDLGLLDDFAADPTTVGAVAPNASQSGNIDFPGDEDWFEASLVANRVYQVDLVSAGAQALDDPEIEGVYDASGQLIPGTRVDDGGAGQDSLLTFVPEATGTYYFGAAGNRESIGSYQLIVSDQGVANIDSFDIQFDLSRIEDPAERDRYGAALETAAARWERVITGDLPFEQVAGFGYVDDILIEVSVGADLSVNSVETDVAAISGVVDERPALPGRTYGLPFRSQIIFDRNNTEIFRYSLDDFATNAVGRALGLGALWDKGRLVQNVDGELTYVGPNALREFQSYFGSVDGADLLSDGSRGGLAGQYWNENRLVTEVMTSLVDYREAPRPPGAIDNQISRISVGALDDLGYEVSLSQSDAYRPRRPASEQQTDEVAETPSVPDQEPSTFSAASLANLAPDPTASSLTYFAETDLVLETGSFVLNGENTSLISADGQTLLFTEGVSGQNYLIDVTGSFEKNSPTSLSGAVGEVSRMDVFSLFGERIATFDWAAKPRDVDDFRQSFAGFDFDDANTIIVDTLPGTGARINVTSEHPATSAIFAGAGDDFVMASDVSDVLAGEGGDDTLQAASGNDTLIGGPGDDALIGGDGNDRADFTGARENYAITLGADGSVMIEDRRGTGDGTDALEGIETLSFTDQQWRLERFADVLDLTPEDFSAFIEMYIAYYNRAPDAEGLLFWGSRLAGGLSLEEAAVFFFNSQEAQDTYPDVQNDPDSAALENFAKDVYSNVLGRAFDPAGLDFWLGQLVSGNVSLPSFLLQIIQGAKAPAPPDADAAFLAQKAADVAYLENKTDLGAYFSVILGMSDTANAGAVMALYDGSPGSIDAAMNQSDLFFDAASQSDGGEFLISLVGLIDNPYGDTGI